MTGGYSTWLGGGAANLFNDQFTIANDIDVHDGFAYVTGSTRAPDFPTVTPLQTDQPGADAFVTKVSQDGSSLAWSTYLGEAGDEEQGVGIDVDASGVAYVTGQTDSASGFPIVNAYQPTYGGGFTDAFLTRISATGTAILYSTYLGGPADDGGTVLNGRAAVAADDAGNAYVLLKSSGAFPTTPGAFQPNDLVGEDAVVVKLNTATTGPASLVYSTYLGGNGADRLNSVAVDASGRAIVGGRSFSSDFPTASPVQPLSSGSALADGTVTVLNASGTGLVHSTPLGGSSFNDSVMDVAQDPSGAVWAAGWSASADFSRPAAASSPAIAGDRDSFVVKLSAGHAQRIADFTADGRTEPSVYRPANNTWYAQGRPALSWGTTGDIPVQGDYDEDGFSDAAVFRPSNGTWYVNGVGEFVLGQSGDIPVPGDYDGDGDVEPAVFRPSTGTWFTTAGPLAFGVAGDIPVPGDYDADGDVEPAVFRPSNGTWYASSGLQAQFGVSGDVPVPGDYDGDGDAEPAVFRPGTGTWYAASGFEAQFGTLGDIPAPGDYNADGRTDAGVFRPANGAWYTRTGIETQWGASGDRPLPLPSAVRQFFFA